MGRAQGSGRHQIQTSFSAVRPPPSWPVLKTPRGSISNSLTSGSAFTPTLRLVNRPNASVAVLTRVEALSRKEGLIGAVASSRADGSQTCQIPKFQRFAATRHSEFGIAGESDSRDLAVMIKTANFFSS